MDTDIMDYDLTTAECASVNTFRFPLPEEMIGRGDIEIYVDYEIEEIGFVSVTYTVWAQLREGYTRKLLLEDTLSGKAGKKTIQKKLLRALSEQEYFVEAISNFARDADA